MLINGRLVTPASILEARARLKEQDVEYTLEAFFTSIEEEDLELVQTFLDAGIDPNGEGQYDETALQGAALLGNVELAQLLLKN